jgi:hypothetical protein
MVEGKGFFDGARRDVSEVIDFSQVRLGVTLQSTPNLVNPRPSASTPFTTVRTENHAS